MSHHLSLWIDDSYTVRTQGQHIISAHDEAEMKSIAFSAGLVVSVEKGWTAEQQQVIDALTSSLEQLKNSLVAPVPARSPWRLIDLKEGLFIRNKAGQRQYMSAGDLANTGPGIVAHRDADHNPISWVLGP